MLSCSIGRASSGRCTLRTAPGPVPYHRVRGPERGREDFMPSLSDTAPASLSLPDEVELERAVDLLGEATEVISHLAWIVRRVGDVQALEDFKDTEARPAYRRQSGDEVPSFEAIGRLHSYAAQMRSYLEEVGPYIENIGGPRALWNLDSVRVELEFRSRRDNA
jgi:hypothetical protein